MTETICKCAEIVAQGSPGVLTSGEAITIFGVIGVFMLMTFILRWSRR